MKTSKAASKKPAEEECGVWLDTAQLKMKAKQKQPARPISKLLNPFLRGEGYSVDVALSFTQTKMEMPKTKQSTISTFFTPQRRVLKNKSTSDEPNTSPAPTSSSSPVLTECAFVEKPEAKQRRDADREPDVCCEWESRNVSEDVVWQEHTGDPLPSQTKQCEEESEICVPRRKRRFSTASLPHGDTHHSLEAWSQDPLFSFSQWTKDEFDLSHKEIKRAKNLSALEPSLSDSLQSETTFGLHLADAEATSTQKSLKQIPSSVVDAEKENGGCSLSPSPKKHFLHSCIDPLKHGVQQQSKADREKNIDSQFEWTKPWTSPLKKPKLYYKTDDDDSLATLFTQDSEGFRVIAHRGLQVRSPLKDQSNMTRATRSVRSVSSRPLVEDDDHEMLFTQDSQGNLVIKH
ncbi:uncharacterized protein aunip [Nelusetta ayraudi]|uniref:uncharacterized protein aunip n=1 Tax=Nelusetta ayraudi TaxID=303726 RepID=UPI003F7061AB